MNKNLSLVIWLQVPGIEKNKFNEYVNTEYVANLEDEELAGHAQRALKAYYQS